MIVLISISSTNLSINSVRSFQGTSPFVIASANQTASEVGQNLSSATGNATQTANQTMGELGKNASDLGGQIMNKAGEVGKTIGSGAADVLGNISGEIKEGVGSK